MTRRFKPKAWQLIAGLAAVIALGVYFYMKSSSGGTKDPYQTATVSRGDI